jgi:hypothetical protein
MFVQRLCYSWGRRWQGSWVREAYMYRAQEGIAQWSQGLAFCALKEQEGWAPGVVPGLSGAGVSGCRLYWCLARFPLAKAFIPVQGLVSAVLTSLGQKTLGARQGKNGEAIRELVRGLSECTGGRFQNQNQS